MVKTFFEHQKYKIHRGPGGKGIAGASHEGSIARAAGLHSQIVVIVKKDHPCGANVISDSG